MKSHPEDQRSRVATPMSDAWEAQAQRWVVWARTPGHDSYWRYHRDRFLRLLPPPEGLVLDVGCGEGRLPRDLRARGYRVIGVDVSPTLIEHARAADPQGDYRVADGAQLPLADKSVQLVTAFMSLHDIDDMPGAVREIARVLADDGWLCAAIVHPINSAGRFESREPDADFVVEDYLQERSYADAIERKGLQMTFTSVHRPLQAYFAALADAGMAVDRLVEVPDDSESPGDRWQRIPLFLQLRARKWRLQGSPAATPRVSAEERAEPGDRDPMLPTMPAPNRGQGRRSRPSSDGRPRAH